MRRRKGENGKKAPKSPGISVVLDIKDRDSWCITWDPRTLQEPDGIYTDAFLTLLKSANIMYTADHGEVVLIFLGGREL